ncbi:hypothetical protein H6P81_009561 [Aristolochia fimbriata]|uniref:Uncharacterized protein n=1 Tax=Aristolochia fimbriata TaxID=158543 RepID=A0AAV7EPG1_ARIFI|nr:hypothetical protein H6P81_009561 [Aristolochia fimbriata]
MWVEHQQTESQTQGGPSDLRRPSKRTKGQMIDSAYSSGGAGFTIAHVLQNLNKNPSSSTEKQQHRKAAAAAAASAFPKEGNAGRQGSKKENTTGDGKEKQFQT